MVLRIAAGVLFTSLVACTPPDMTDDLTGNVSGEKVYKHYCISCHGPDGKRGVGKASDLSKSSLNDREIRTIILFGNAKGMPSYQSIIKDDEEREELIKYIKTLRKD